MKSNKTFILVLIIIILIIISLLIYYFSDDSSNFSISNTISNIVSKPNENTNTNSSNNKSNNNTIIYEDHPNLENVIDYNNYFTINNIINDYYKKIINNDTESLLDIIDKSYIISNKLNKTNINSLYQNNYQDITYYSKEMYFKSKNNIMYYFVSGETESYNFTEDTLEENTNINYLVIIDSNNNSYSITPLDVEVVFNYGSIYNMLDNKEIESNANNKYANVSYSDEDISILYIAYYKNILFINSEKAYDMLTNSYKLKYNDYEDFFNNIPNIYESLTTKFLGSSASGDNGKRTYNIITTNEIKITIYENSIMNFNIEIK